MIIAEEATNGDRTQLSWGGWCEGSVSVTEASQMWFEGKRAQGTCPLCHGAKPCSSAGCLKDRVVGHRGQDWQNAASSSEGLTEGELEGFPWEDSEVSLVLAAGTWGGRESREGSGAQLWSLVCELLKLTAEPSQTPDTDWTRPLLWLRSDRVHPAHTLKAWSPADGTIEKWLYKGHKCHRLSHWWISSWEWSIAGRGK